MAAASILTEWHNDPRHKRLRFIGIDTDVTVLKAIREGAIDATVAQNPYGHGYVSCAILRLLLTKAGRRGKAMSSSMPASWS